MAGIAIAHDRRDDEGHGENVRAQAFVVKARTEHDVLAEADDRDGVLSWPRPRAVGAV